MGGPPVAVTSARRGEAPAKASCTAPGTHDIFQTGVDTVHELTCDSCIARLDGLNQRLRLACHGPARRLALALALAADGASLACLRHSTVASVGPLLQCRMSGLRWEGMHVCDLAAAKHFT